MDAKGERRAKGTRNGVSSPAGRRGRETRDVHLSRAPPAPGTPSHPTGIDHVFLLPAAASYRACVQHALRRSPTYTPRRPSSSLSLSLSLHSIHPPDTFRPHHPFPPSRSLVLSLATHFTLAIVSERYIAILAKTTVLANQAKGGRDYSKPFNEFEIEEFFFFFFFFFF